MQLYLLVPPVRPKPGAPPCSPKPVLRLKCLGRTVGTCGSRTQVPAEQRNDGPRSRRLTSEAGAVTPCPGGATTLSGGGRMLSRQQRSSRFLLVLSASRAKPYHRPLPRSYGVTRCECSALFHFQSGCIIKGFFFTKDLKYSHARGPGPGLAKTAEQRQRRQCVCIVPRMISRRSKG